MFTKAPWQSALIFRGKALKIQLHADGGRACWDSAGHFPVTQHGSLPADQSGAHRMKPIEAHVVKSLTSCGFFMGVSWVE